MEIRDSCWYAPIALQQTIELIRESITPYPGKKSTEKLHQCSDTPNVTHDSPLIGVAGPASSSIALQVQNLLQLFSIPQIGYSTTSKDLSDKARFSSFMRVVPSDYYQAQVMIDIVKFYNWTYISTVHTGNDFRNHEKLKLSYFSRWELRAVRHSSISWTRWKKWNLHSSWRQRKEIKLNFLQKKIN